MLGGLCEDHIGGRKKIVRRIPFFVRFAEEKDEFAGYAARRRGGDLLAQDPAD